MHGSRYQNHIGKEIHHAHSRHYILDNHGAVAAVLIIAFIALIILVFRWDDMGEEYWEEYWGKDEEE